MTIEEMHDGYKKEIAYQKHMLKNIGYWFQLFTAISGIGIVLIYFFSYYKYLDKHSWNNFIHNWFYRNAALWIYWLERPAEYQSSY